MGLSCGSTAGWPGQSVGLRLRSWFRVLCPDGVLRGTSPSRVGGMHAPRGSYRGTVGTAQGALLLRWWLWPQQLHIVLGAARPVCVREAAPGVTRPSDTPGGWWTGQPLGRPSGGGWSMQQPRPGPGEAAGALGQPRGSPTPLRNRVPEKHSCSAPRVSFLLLPLAFSLSVHFQAEALPSGSPNAPAPALSPSSIPGSSRLPGHPGPGHLRPQPAVARRRTAAAIRTAAVSCLWALGQQRRPVGQAGRARAPGPRGEGMCPGSASPESPVLRRS